MEYLKPFTYEELCELGKEELSQTFWLEKRKGLECNVYQAKIAAIENYCLPVEYDIHEFKAFCIRVLPNTDIKQTSGLYNTEWRLWPSQPSIEESRRAPWRT